MTIGNESYDAVLYDNAAGRFMADNLPFGILKNPEYSDALSENGVSSADVVTKAAIS